MATVEWVEGAEMVRLDITNNWTGLDELAFELVAERLLEIEAESEKGPLTVNLGEPVLVNGLGWLCPFVMSAMGRVHASSARGVDAVEARQAAYVLVDKQLEGIRRRHKITFTGSDDLGFAAAGVDAAPKAAGCPVMSGSV